MKRIIILSVVLAIVLIGAVFYFINQESNQQDTTRPDETQQNDSLPSSEPQGEGLPRQVSVSTQEELFQEIRNAVNEHLNK
tara:strand:- start:1325 stop:1567 length:243 start_codon:yes stop_codon:yes gene_type:complete